MSAAFRNRQLFVCNHFRFHWQHWRLCHSKSTPVRLAYTAHGEVATDNHKFVEKRETCELTSGGWDNVEPVYLNVDLFTTFYPFLKKRLWRPPLFILHGVFGQKTNWNSIAKSLRTKLKTQFSQLIFDDEPPIFVQVAIAWTRLLPVRYPAFIISVRKRVSIFITAGNIILTIDLRNHGESCWSDNMSYFDMASDVKHLADSLNYDNVVLLGHSMGGKVVARLAMDYPSFARGLIIEDIALIPSRDETLSSINFIELFASAMKSIHFAPRASIADARRSADAALKSTVQSATVRQFLLTNLTERDGNICWKLNLTALVKNASLIQEFPGPIKTYRGRTLLIVGKKSNHVKESQIEHMKQTFPNIQIQYIDSEHWVHSEKPTDFIQAIADFMSTSAE